MKIFTYSKAGIVFIILFLLNGCAPVSEIKGLYKLDNGTYFEKSKKFDESRILFSKQLKGYMYDNKILLHETGKKIRIKEEAIERLSFLSNYKELSGKEKSFGVIAAIWSVPVSLIFKIAENIAGIPAAPLVYYLEHKYKKDSFESYKKGDNCLKEGNYKEARNYFSKAKEAAPFLIQYSDIYFKIAKTYFGEGNKNLARNYYLLFIDYSLCQYPPYFEKFNKEYKNDLSELEKEFDIAGEELQ